MRSWRDGTKCQHQRYVKKWFEYCEINRISISLPPIKDVVEFLMMTFKTGVGYIALNTARSALSTITENEFGQSIGKDPVIFRFIKGVFEKRPSLPRYAYTWDVRLLFNYFREQPTVDQLNPKELTLKLTIGYFVYCQAAGVRRCIHWTLTIAKSLNVITSLLFHQS